MPLHTTEILVQPTVVLDWPSQASPCVTEISEDKTLFLTLDLELFFTDLERTLTLIVNPTVPQTLLYKHVDLLT